MPEPMIESVQNNGLKTGTGEDRLQYRTCGRVAFKDDIDFFFNGFQHAA